MEQKRPWWWPPLRLMWPGIVLVGVLTGCAESCQAPDLGLCQYDGEPLTLGQRIPARDGCNTCTCLSTGAVACTERACAPEGDAGVGGMVDGGSPDPGGPPTVDAGAPRPPTACVDEDQDGFYSCLDENYPEWPQAVDCDDSLWFVQPGGAEFADNGVDDDCDDEVDELPTCTCAPGNGASAAEVLAAMDLCDESILSVTRRGDGQQFGVYEEFYEDIVPQMGSCLGMISTGIAGATELELDGADLCGCSFFGCDDDPDPTPDPDAFGEDVCDLAQVRLTLRPPSNAKGFEFSFMFVSAEWPEFLCSSYNDTFYTLYTSGAVAGGEVANISFDAQQRQITVNVGFFESPREWSVSLENTPFGAVDDGATCTDFPVEGCMLPGYCDDPNMELDRIGSGSGWLSTRAPVEPGEESIDLVFSIHDEGDGIYDSAVFLDDFRWLPYPPSVATVKE